MSSRGKAAIVAFGIALACVIAPGIRDAAAWDPVSFAEVAADVPMAAHPAKVVDYTLRAKLDPVAHTVHGEGTVTWTNVSSKPVNELWLHLYLNGFKNQSSVF